MAKSKRVAIYARVSTDSQSTDNQVRELRQVAKRHGWAVVAEYVDQGISGTIVRARDARAMANAIVELLSDERRRRSMGEAGLARVKARFTVERMVAATAKVYARTAGTPHVTDTANPSVTG